MKERCERYEALKCRRLAEAPNERHSSLMMNDKAPAGRVFREFEWSLRGGSDPVWLRSTKSSAFLRCFGHSRTVRAGRDMSNVEEGGWGETYPPDTSRPLTPSTRVV